MTPEQLNEARAVAGKLTEAQRQTLVEALGGDGLFVTRWKHGRSVRRLHSLGLTYAPPPMPGGLIAGLTPLGIAVRQILQEHPNG